MSPVGVISGDLVFEGRCSQEPQAMVSTTEVYYLSVLVAGSEI